MKKREKNIEKTKVNYKHSKIVYFSVLLFVVSVFSTGVHYLLNLNNTKTNVVEQNSLAETNTEGIYTYTVTDGKATIIKCDISASGAITIPSTLGGYPVTSIIYAFSGCRSLTSITIPASVTNIGEDAFSFCTSLTSITIPNSVTSIGAVAFDSCVVLTNITIPNSVTSIGESAFNNCYELKSITIPDSVTSIAVEAFYGCSSLKNVIIPNSVISIGERSFGYALYNDDGNFTESGKISGFTIYGTTGTAAQTYATANGFTFIDNTVTNLSICTVSIISNQTYTGKTIKPKVIVKNGTTTLKNGTDYTVAYKNNTKIGTVTITITGKGNYTGTKKVYFYIIPKTAKLSSVKSSKTKQIKVSWSKDTTVTGYQVIYSTSSKFASGNKTATISKNSTTSKTITKLTKGKKYYVKVRSYKTVSGKKIYGSWSAVKNIKCK